MDGKLPKSCRLRGVYRTQADYRWGKVDGGNRVVSLPLIVRYYNRLPQPQQGDDEDLWMAGLQSSLREFREAVVNNYTDATLERLLTHLDPITRQAATLALGLVGGPRTAFAVSAMLHDRDRVVRRFAHDALWEIWFRGEDENQCRKLREVLKLEDFSQSLAALDELVREYPTYAEAWNQRALLYYRRGEYSRSVADCERVLRLNPVHFAAASGMGQCYLRMKKPRAALRAFHTALSINPELESIREAVSALKAAFGDD